ncbi:inhibitor of KinA [Geomicrobium halophilum]|uniref:Inhibitor of KinA n=1 Tax=Geomicrobium halophilum TaxID=549000 RepID=A0A841PSG6_9BACL|nr:5-oxoprolinase subunit PxpB [Geomicrobium halophilum]MBB6450126.1 inhibitor of KinA [Geomicrobium halophilum]
MLYPLSENAIHITLGHNIDPEIHQRVKKIMERVEEEPFHGYVECVPSYTGVTVFYDPINIYHTMEEKKGSPSESVMRYLKKVVDSLDAIPQSKESGNVVTIPVCYDEDFGPDLSHVAVENGLTKDEVIQIHTSGEYLVYMIGFAPGFPFLGGMEDDIATPRKREPRTKIPAGSVGIAGSQTGIYPIETPGGWQLIGQTPVRMFDSHREEPSLLKAGDHVRFKAITYEEFNAYKEGDL